MSKKILAVLAPVAALIAFAVVPTMAQATTAQVHQSGGVTDTLAQGAIVRGQSVNPVFTTNTGAKLQCTKGTMSGTVTSDPGASHVTGNITSDTFTNNTGGPCATDGAFGGTAHIKTNATASTPWTLQIQQPEASGQITGHVNNATNNLQFTSQIQVFGFSVTTCDYSIPSLQVMGSEGNDTLTAEANTFTLQGGNPETCGEEGEFTGSFQMEDEAGNPVQVDMT